MGGSAVVAVRVVISGRVQGVGYRHWTAGTAARLGIDGWVRNLPDGTVEALLAGPPDTVRAMLVACREGPRLALVAEIVEHNADPPVTKGFREVR